jgi:hydroxymethylglutaryl-CoA reductase (NADPH)
MSESDRRSTPRVQFEDDTHPMLHFLVAGEPITARIEDLSKNGLRISLEVQHAQGIESNLTLLNLKMSVPGAKDRILNNLAVKEAFGTHADTWIIRLEAKDDKTRAALWLAMEDIAVGETGLAARASSPPENLEKIPARGIYTEEARLERLAFIRKQTARPLTSLDNTTLKPERLTGNIENLMGSVEVPVGLAGPMWFRGENAHGVLFAPLATTEGALVASATRGATAITRSGGVTTRIIRQQMMRVPLFVLSDMHGAFLFSRWIRDHIDELREQIQRVSSHANLVEVEPMLLGNMVHVRFLYATGDAAGQNMTTTCTWHACQWLMQKMKHFDDIQFDNFLIEANMSGDKKVNFQSFIAGRGTRVTAECFLKTEVLEQVLKVSPDELMKTNQVVIAGSQQVGMVGYNINVANIIAGMFTATGQDIACVHESSLAQLHLQQVKGGVYASMMMPSLIIGTVGGGTHLTRQNELLQMMDCAGPGKVPRLAEIIAGFCLALDLSTMSAVASGQFASAHERLGRNRPVEWFTRKDLTPEFFQDTMRQALTSPELVCESVAPVENVRMGSSILTELTARKVKKLIGHIPLRLSYRTTPNEEAQSVDVITKVKPLDDEVILMSNRMAAMCGARLAAAYKKFKDRTGFAACHTRELAVYGQSDSRFTDHAPKIYGLHMDEAREAYVVVMERLQDMVLMDTADNITGWQQQHIEAALSGIAQVHAIWYGKGDELRQKPWIGHVQSVESMTEMTELWEALGVHAFEEFPEWVGRADLALHRRLVRGVDNWYHRFDDQPKTLIHNDFNPRNIALRQTDAGLRLCAYDWELATIHVPQHDLAELLCFVLTPTTREEEVNQLVEHHRTELERATGESIDPEQWRWGYRASLYDLAINRFALYVMAHTFRHYGFMERVVRTLRHLIRLETGK